MVTEDRSRGQVILIGAIALAFIILGVVVVFNGILYTETLSSGESSQGAADASAVELEVREGIGCLLHYAGEDDVDNLTDEEFNAFGDAYRNTTASSQPSILDVEPDAAEERQVKVTYESRDISYTRSIEITPDDCPDRGAGG